jgi:ABC-type Fe3+ transport system permease subunit
MKVKYFLPLVGFVVPTVVIGFGFVIPSSPIAGINALTIGFGSTIVSACAAYVTGVWTILGDRPST